MPDDPKADEKSYSWTRTLFVATATVVVGLALIGVLCWVWACLYSTNMVASYNAGVEEGKRIGHDETIAALKEQCIELKREQTGIEALKTAWEKRLDDLQAMRPIDPIRLWYRVAATREGLVGEKTASGHVIGEESVFVALPSRKALGKVVEVRYGGRSIKCKVEDVGPWSTDDAYWATARARPLSEEGLRKPAALQQKYGGPKNNAGIDLSNGLWDLLGIPRGVGIAPVEWRFVGDGE